MVTAAMLAVSAPAIAYAAPLRIWYRSSEGCPEGVAFIARLRELGRDAALANVGDQVDFVVTLAARSEQSSGRLERQTARGTVAIRELRAAHCEEVAEALALSLELALAPNAVMPEPAATHPSGVEAVAAPEPERPAAVDRSLPPEPPAGTLGYGAAVSIESGSAPGLMPGALVFVTFRPGAAPFAIRGALRGAYRSGDIRNLPLEVGIGAARLEVCPWAWRLGPMGLGPCLAFDAGLIYSQSEGERASSDTGFWGAAAGHLRATWPSPSLLALESQIGAMVPFVRYRLGEPGGDTLHRADPVGFQAALGFVWRH